jgi:hypothetical protein
MKRRYQKAAGFIFPRLPTPTQERPRKTQGRMDANRSTGLFNEWIDYVFVLKKKRKEMTRRQYLHHNLICMPRRRQHGTPLEAICHLGEDECQ